MTPAAVSWQYFYDSIMPFIDNIFTTVSRRPTFFFNCLCFSFEVNLVDSNFVLITSS